MKNYTPLLASGPTILKSYRLSIPTGGDTVDTNNPRNKLSVVRVAPLPDIEGLERDLHPSGVFEAICIRASCQEPNSGAEQIVQLSFLTTERRLDGSLGKIGKRFHGPFDEMNCLWRFLTYWRGHSVTQEESREGLQLGELLGRSAWIRVGRRVVAGLGLREYIATIEPNHSNVVEFSNKPIPAPDQGVGEEIQTH